MAALCRLLAVVRCMEAVGDLDVFSAILISWWEGWGIQAHKRMRKANFDENEERRIFVGKVAFERAILFTANTQAVS